MRLLPFLLLPLTTTSFIPLLPFTTTTTTPKPIKSTTTTTLPMSLLDSFSNFIQSRTGDFVKLEDSQNAYGPGPLIIGYRIPTSIEDEEFLDMAADGAPSASKKGVKLVRLETCEGCDGVTVEEALKRAVAGEAVVPSQQAEMATSVAVEGDGVPVLFFSGFDNSELMATYDIMGGEIYRECGAAAACAKAVPNAMRKPLGQVLEEISGDHLDALGRNDVET